MVENWIKAIRDYQKRKKREVTNISAVGYLTPNGRTNQPLRNEIRDNINPKFKYTDALEKFPTTRKVIMKEIYQPLFDEFNNGINNPRELRI